MKRILAILLLLLASALGARAQLGNVYLKHFTSDPTGTACGKNQMAVNDSTLLLYGCNAGVFALYTSGGFPAGTFSTNGGANASQTGLNFLTSTANTLGLTITPSNPATNQMKFELTGLLNPTGGGTGLSNPTAHSLLLAEGAGVFNVVPSPTANGDYGCMFHVTAGVGVDTTCPQIGVLPRVISGATATDTPTFADATCAPIVHDKAASAALTVTLPTPTTLGNSNACLIFENHSANIDTLKATTWTIQQGQTAAVAGATGISVPPGTKVSIFADTFNATNWLADEVPLTGGTAAFANVATGTSPPAAPTGGTAGATLYTEGTIPTGGGVGAGVAFPYANSTTKCLAVDAEGADEGCALTVGRQRIFNFNQAAQSQVVVSATEYYITHSDLDMPATYRQAIAAGTTMHWRIALTKTAAGTGTFQILLKKGTNGSTADTSIVTQTIGTQTAAADNMEVDISLTWTSATAAYWTMIPRQGAASGTGFGLVYPAAAAQFSGTISAQTTTTASDKYGVSVIFTTGTPTFVVNEVAANAYGVL